jgi:Phosphoesterase family
MPLGTLAVLVAAAAGAPAAGAAAGGSTTTLAPVADAYVTPDRPRQNFGRASALLVGGRPASVAYLRFKISVPAGQTVSRAMLQLYASSSSSGFTVHPVAGTTWGETTTTYVNAPRIGSRVVGSSGTHRGKAYVSVDVTSLVTRSGLVSLAVKRASRAALGFNSRESRSGRPRLVVSLAPPPEIGPVPGGAPCGTVAAPPSRVDHVIWIWMENKPYDAVIGSPSAPFENELASACGLATNYHAVAHPSLPNYIAATSGSTQGIVDDAPPAAHRLEVPSVYSQLRAVGKGWRDYAEGAPSNCPLESSGTYAVKHDPAAYYTGIRLDCAQWDVPMGTTSGGRFLTDLTGNTLPSFAFVVPDLCNDTHDCPVTTGDDWLRAWFTKILASPAYLSGRTVVFLTWDEDDGSASNRVPLVVVSPSTRPGTRSATFFDHYSLLKTTEQLLGITTFLGRAGDPGTTSMVSTFNLG